MKFGAALLEGIKAAVSAIPLVGPAISSIMGAGQAQKSANQQKHTQSQVETLSAKVQELMQQVKTQNKVKGEYNTVDGQSAAPQYSQDPVKAKSLNKVETQAPVPAASLNKPGINSDMLKSAATTFKDNGVKMGSSVNAPSAPAQGAAMAPAPKALAGAGASR